MLCVNRYPREYVQACRARVDAQLAAWRTVATATPKGLAAHEAHVFANLVSVLDASFMHRSRTLEKKDGNAMNEVRMLAASLLRPEGVLVADASIKYAPERSVLGLRIGDAIALDAASFGRLATAYFDAVETTFA